MEASRSVGFRPGRRTASLLSRRDGGRARRMTMSDRTPQEPGAPSGSAASAEESARRAEAAAARAREDSEDALALSESARVAAMEAARKAGRFSREFVVTVISVVTTAFGVVVALAWNTALSAGLTKWFGVDGRIAA